MSNCVFCKIVKGDIPSTKAYEDEQVYAFHDINPAAPVHVLFIPKKHIKSMADIKEEDLPLIAHIHWVIHKLADELGLKEGYRIVNNCGKAGGQEVPHLHFHLLGGRSLSWPAG